MNKKELQYFNIGRDYLLSFDSITNEMIDGQLNAWKNQQLTSLPEGYEAILKHATNRRGMRNSIGSVKNIQHLLFDFNHKKVLQEYNDWEDIFDAVNNDDYTPRGPMEKLNNKNLWVIYSKTLFSAAKFLSQFETYKSFAEMIEDFMSSEYTKITLPLYLSQSIFGLGQALACDFIKENISPEFIKADVHIREIAKGLNISNSENDFIVCSDVARYCTDINKLEYEVDKLWWLIGSGKFYEFDVVINTTKSDYLQLCERDNK